MKVKYTGKNCMQVRITNLSLVNKVNGVEN